MRLVLVPVVLAVVVGLSGCGGKSSPSKAKTTGHPGHYKNKPPGY
jgi:hypothetical protein